MQAATGVSCTHAPKEGDISICGQCAAVLQFKPDLTLQSLGPEILASLSDDERKAIARAQEIVLSYPRDQN